MTEQFDSLNEKSKLVNVAARYTGGDIEKAKNMVSGEYEDNIVVKGKFLLNGTEQTGVFIAFFNFIDEYIGNVTTFLSNDPGLYDKLRVFDDWKTLYRDLNTHRGSEDTIDSHDFSSFLLDSFIGYDVFPDVHERNLDELTRTVTEIIGKSFNESSVQCQVELESTSSLQIDLAGIDIDVPDAHEEKAQEDSTEVVEDERITKIEKDADYIIEGKSVIAPVKGKYINDIAIGEKVKVFLPGGDLVSEKILKLMNAIDSEGKRSSIPGRIKAKIPMEKSGYIIYALVAKGCLAKIIEEENVKIEVDIPLEESDSMGSDNKIIYLMAILVGLIILAGIILINIL